MSFFNSSMPSCYSTFTERRQLDQDLQYVLVAFYTTIMVCIWITNSAVIFAITSLKLVKKNGSIELILYLCVSDLALGSTGHSHFSFIGPTENIALFPAHRMTALSIIFIFHFQNTCTSLISINQIQYEKNHFVNLNTMHTNKYKHSKVFNVFVDGREYNPLSSMLFTLD